MMLLFYLTQVMPIPFPETCCLKEKKSQDPIKLFFGGGEGVLNEFLFYKRLDPKTIYHQNTWLKNKIPYSLII